MVRLRLEKADDFPALVKFFIDNDLEFDEGEAESLNVVNAYKITHGGDMIAGICLTNHDGQYVIDGIAVDKIYRHMKLGKMMLEKIIEKVLELGGESIILVARAPEFFKKFGFEPVPLIEQPDFFDCKDCPQNGTKCFPEVLRLQLK